MDEPVELTIQEKEALELQRSPGDASVGGSVSTYILVPLLFLAVTLLGGMRFDAADNAFIFFRPALICLIFAAVLTVLFFRARLIVSEAWFSGTMPVLQNAANAAVMLALFAASVQVFNSLLPEAGLPFWVIGFCFVWVLWNDLFLDLEPRTLLRSLGGMFALAFAAKYLLLANLVTPGDQSWFERITQNPAKEAFTYLLDLPRYSAATGYVQFITLGLYLIGLVLLPRATNTRRLTSG